MEAIGWVGRALWLAAWIVVATAGVVMLTQAFGWSGSRLVAMLQTLTPYLIVTMAPIAIVAMRRGQTPLAFTAGLIGASGVLMAGPLVFGPSQPPARDAAIGVTVASVNLLYTNETIGDSADELVAQDVDVIVFSEYTAEFHGALTAHRLADSFPFRIERDGLRAGGIAIWSRFPLHEQERMATTNFSIDAVVDGPDGPFSMVGIHPPAPVFDFGAWKHDLELLRARAAEATSPTLLIGDVNSSYWHPLFRDLLSEDFVDAHMAHGKGFSTSWPHGDWRPRFVRLDHALTGRGLVSTGVVDFDVPGSDHLGFVVTVAPAR